MLVEGVCYDWYILLAKFCYTLPCFVLYSKANLTVTVPEAGILHIECSTFHSIIFQDLE